MTPPADSITPDHCYRGPATVNPGADDPDLARA